MSKINPAVNDPEVLEMLYWQEGLSMHRIAERLGVAETTVYRRMEEYGIDRRGVGYNSVKGNQSKELQRFCRHKVDNDGYPVWKGTIDVDGFSTTFVHQLLLVAEDHDPHKVYADEWHCHHENGVKWDNRPDNLDLWTREDHMRHHAHEQDLGSKGGWKKYSDEELLEWIDAFVMEFGIPPTQPDMRGWPGPGSTVYAYRFGSVAEAIEEAGYEPVRNR